MPACLVFTRISQIAELQINTFTYASMVRAVSQIAVLQKNNTRICQHHYAQYPILVSYKWQRSQMPSIGSAVFQIAQLQMLALTNSSMVRAVSLTH
jgi:hypothetical protein